MNNVKKIGIAVLSVLFVFAIHFFLIKNTAYLQMLTDTGFPLQDLYLFQLILSVVIWGVILYFGPKYPNYTGFIFLGLITLKFVLNYVFIQSGLEKSHADILKYNYLVTVLVLLVIDVIFAYKALNADHKS